MIKRKCCCVGCDIEWECCGCKRYAKSYNNLYCACFKDMVRLYKYNIDIILDKRQSWSEERNKSLSDIFKICYPNLKIDHHRLMPTIISESL